MDAELQQALTYHRSGKLREAEALYRRMLTQRPSRADANHLLGVLTAQTNRFAEAYRHLHLAESLQPGNLEIRCDLGRVAATLGKFDEAESCFQKALSVAPTNLVALTSLANVLLRTRRLDEAKVYATTAVQLAPQQPEGLSLLANICLEQGDDHQTEELCRKGLRAAPTSVELHMILGAVLRRRGDLDGALSLLQRAESLPGGQENPIVAHHLGMLYFDKHDYAKAEARFTWALSHGLGANDEVKYALGESVIAQGRDAEGRALLDQVIGRNNRNWLVRWSRMLAFPIIYETPAQIAETRQDFDRQLTALEADTAAYLHSDLPEMLKAAQYKTDFLLHYQGGNDVALQRRFGGLITRIAAAAHPARAEPLPKRPIAAGERVRVGFASGHFRSHSVAKTHGSWITELPRDRFDVSLFHLTAETDEVTEQLKRDTTYHACGTLSPDELIARIAAERLDVLIWLDIGMEARAQIPSALRLAPVQATTWGHPVTSGLPNIDYYLSSADMEPAGGESHYSETLVRLPHLSIAYPRPPVDRGTLPATVAKMKEQGQTLFLCAQSLFKLLPQHDDVFAAIAQAVPDAMFLFIAHKEGHATQAFSDRLYRAFAAAGLSSDNRVTLLPRLSQADFFAVNRAADVVLDSIGWAGCNSTLEALACDRPVVTLPGETMRARHGLAILNRIGLSELIARDKSDYVAIAARLGHDAAFLQDISARIAARKASLYGDRVPLDALAAWLDSVARGDGQAQ